MNKRACAHRTWLLRHVEVAVNQSPIANGCLSLRQRQHFRMGGSVLEQLHLIMGAANNFSCKHNNRAYRDFAGVAGFLRLSQCFAHEIFVSRLKHLAKLQELKELQKLQGKCSWLEFRVYAA